MSLKNLLHIALRVGACLLAASPTTLASPPPKWDTYADTWSATDALGRALPTYEQVGTPRKDRTVGLFYFLWLGAHTTGGPYDISKILKQEPLAMQNPTSPLWGPMIAMHHWGESIFGYYQAEDPFVLRKHAQMISDADVDVLIFDVTNQFTYPTAYHALLKVFSEVRAAGGKAPQIAFLCPFGDPAKVVKTLYADLYDKGLYSDLWFRWEGKPLILADPYLLAVGEGNLVQDTPVPLLPNQKIGQSFLAKKPFEAVGGRFPNWATQGAALTLSLFAEGAGGKRVATQRFENTSDNAWLSLTLKTPLPAGNYYLEASDAKGRVGWWSHSQDVYPNGQAYLNGSPTMGDRTLQIVEMGGEEAQIRNFFTFRKPQPDYFAGQTSAKMWSWLEVSPQHVFRNAKGEKEQMSVGAAQNAIGSRLGTLSEPGARGRNYHNGANDTRPNAVLYGYNAAEQWEHALKEDPKFIFVTGWNEWTAARYDEFLGIKRPVMFVDTFNQENSRDIEPMRGGHADNYYYQMVSYIRRYKGVRKPPSASLPKTIRLEGNFHQWDDVQPEYRDDIGDTIHRDYPGYNKFTQYVNKTGRNDLVLLKVTADSTNVYFYARTKDPVTPHTDPHWMTLYIDTDSDPKTGWLGYDFAVNRHTLNSTTTLLEASNRAGNWRYKAETHYRAIGNEIMFSIRRRDLDLENLRKPIRLHFKWADNYQQEDDPMEFTLNGDSAPNGCFNYLFFQKAQQQR